MPSIEISLLIPGVLVGAVTVIIFYLRYSARRRVRTFLHKPLPCSFDASIFPRTKSLFDILIDLGFSLKCLELLTSELNWFHGITQLNHSALNQQVANSITLFGSYTSFISAIKAKLKAGVFGAKFLEPPTPLESAVLPKGVNGKNESLKRLLEERQAFNAMFAALRDETKNVLAQKLGIAHRFDYLTGEVFRSLGENKKRHLAVSLDFRTHSNADLLVAFGTLSMAAGAGFWALDSAGEVLATTSEAVGAAAGAESAIGGEAAGEVGLEGLGEAFFYLGIFLFAFGTAKRAWNWFRGWSLRKYQNQFKAHMEQLAARFQEKGRDALRVSQTIIHALEIELSRLAGIKVICSRMTPLNSLLCWIGLS
jgi:hypothetical protein